MPPVLLLAARYIAIFVLVIALLLVFVRWRFPMKETQGTGSGAGGSRESELSYWRALWLMYRRARKRNRERDKDLKAIRRKRVLVVDPYEKSSKVLVWRLEQLGCNVTRVRTGFLALKHIREGAVFDAIISDSLLPDISATNFCDALADWDIPAVLVGVLKTRREELSRLEGKVGFLGKHYDPDDAAALAGRLIRNRLKVASP